MGDDRSLLRPGNSRTVSETSPVRHDLLRSNSYDGRLILPFSQDYTHQTYADPSDSKFLRAKIANGDFKSFIDRNTGLLLVAASQVFFAGMNVFAKLLSNPTDPLDKPVSTFQLIFVRMSLTYVFAIAYMIYNKVPEWFLGPKEVRGLLLLRSSVGFMGLFSIYYSLQYLPLSDATVLTFLTPCFTLVLGYLFLGESFTRREALAGLIALIGVVFIARPLSFFGSRDPSASPDLPSNNATLSDAPIPIPVSGEATTDAQRLSAVLVSLLGVVGAGGAYVTIRCIGKRAHALISVSMFSLVACIFSLGGLIVTRQPIVVPRGQALIYLITLGFSGFIAQFLLTMGLQREKAGRGSTAMYLQLLFACFWERVIFKTLPDCKATPFFPYVITADCRNSMVHVRDPSHLGQYGLRRRHHGIQHTRRRTCHNHDRCQHDYVSRAASEQRGGLARGRRRSDGDLVAHYDEPGREFGLIVMRLCTFCP